MISFKFRKNFHLLVPFLFFATIFQAKAADSNFACGLNFSCPNDTLVVNSVHPDSTGKPIILNPSLLDTLYYEDTEVFSSCSSIGIDRTWYLIDTNGGICTCVQRLNIVRDFTKIILPKDTTLQRCLSPTELANLDSLGTPTIYDIPLEDDNYNIGIIIQYADEIISAQQIKRTFWYIDWCNPTPIFQLIGVQYINLLYPSFDLLELDIKDPTQTNILDQICNEDAVHFCLSYGGAIPPYNGVDNITWEYNDNNSGWQDELDSDFDKFCFVAQSGKVSIDCASSQTGFTERIYRAKINVVDPISLDNCEYTSDEDTLLICCPIDPTSSISILTNTQMCEGDTQTVQIALNSNDFVETIASNSYINIDWKINGNADASLNNTTAFNHFLTAGITDYCFEATITNCGGKQLVVTECIQIDPKPICGTIIGLPTPATLTQINTNPKEYTICPYNDASIGIDQPFLNCTPQWQYSYDLSTWNDLGYSNTVQNTNVIPSHLWPSNTDAIYYRISCQPLSILSACEPCNGDTLKIKLRAAPDTVMIAGNSPVCSGSNTTLTVTNPQTGANPPVSYTWLNNGVVVGTGTSYLASQEGCYWVEASDGCQVTPSAQFCLDVCDVEPIISCPLMPNECAYLGQSVTLSGCDSQSSCGNIGLSYQWTYDSGTVISTNGCTIEHMPATGGTTYTLTVTDANGCSASTTRFVKPCSN